MTDFLSLPDLKAVVLTRVYVAGVRGNAGLQINRFELKHRLVAYCLLAALKVGQSLDCVAIGRGAATPHPHGYT